MRKRFLLALFLCALPALAQANSQWVLEKSTLTYHVSHPLHQVYGTSHAAKGKGVCQAGECNFLIAAPLKSFDSGDSDRDIHMLQVTRGAQFPMVVVRARFPQAALNSATIDTSLTVQFAGQTARYAHITFQRIGEGTDMRITGTIPATCSDFKIPRPSLLAMPIKNRIPVKVDATWHRM